MFLNDERYEDEDGKWVDRNEIDCLGTYQHLMDGFFKWECGNPECRKEQSSRAYRIGGVVFRCGHCRKKNLLVRTDIRFINQALATADRNESDAEKRISQALYHLGHGIAALGKQR